MSASVCMVANRPSSWLVGLLLLVPVGALAGTPAPTQEWRSIIGLPALDQSTTRLAAADLDGDGTDEFVATLAMVSYPGGNPVSGIGVVGHDGDWRIREVEAYRDAEFGEPLTVRRPGGDAVVVHRRHRYYGPGYTEAYELWVFSGAPLQRERIIPIDIESRPLAAGDVDGDGDVDVVEVARQMFSTWTTLRARDLASGAVLWTRTAPTEFGTVALAQLDGDAAREVIAGNSPGQVYDGTLGLTEWVYPAGFDFPVAGRFDAADPVSFASVAPDRVVYFRHAPLSPVEDQPHSGEYPRGIAVANLDADAEDEIVLGAYQSIQVVDRGSALRQVPMGEGILASLAVGQADADAALEFALTASVQAQSTMRVIDAASETEEFAASASLSYSGLVVEGDLDGSGEAQILVLDTGWYSSFGDAVHARVFSSADGRPLREASLRGEFYMPLGDAFRPAQIDADPALELVVGVAYQRAGYVALDLGSLELQRVGSFGPGSTELEWLVAAHVADVDADGSLEIVSLGRGSSDAVIEVRDVAGGALEWRSVGIPDPSDRGSLHLADADADAAKEMLLFAGQDLYVFDGATHLLDASVELQNAGDTLAVAVREEGDCEVTVYSTPEAWPSDASASFRQFDCAGGLKREFSLPGPDFARLRYGPFEAAPLAGVRDGHLALLDPRRRTIEVGSGYLGAHPGENGLGLAPFAGDAASWRVVTANDGSVRAFRIEATPVFGDGFE